FYLLSFLHCYADLSVSRSFPTRRSSDLLPLRGRSHPFLPELKMLASVLESYRPQINALAQSWLARGAAQVSLWEGRRLQAAWPQDRKSTRLNSSHVKISYAVFCLKKKK